MPMTRTMASLIELIGVVVIAVALAFMFAWPAGLLALGVGALGYGIVLDMDAA